MGSSDLNLKKSWHVGRAANISAIQKAEAEAIAERKKLAQRLNEIKEERKKEEIQKQLAVAGGIPVTQRVEWMYTGGPGDGQNDSAANEAFLLGKRTLDKLLVSQDNEAKQLQKQAAQDRSAPAQSALPARDTATKVREDPLLAIRRSEADAYGAMMNDPIKRRQLLASMGIDDPKPKSKSRDERHRRHRHHHRHHDHHYRDDNLSDDEERSRKKRRSDYRDRSRSPRRYVSEDEGERRRKGVRRRSYSRGRDEKDHDHRDKRESRGERHGSHSPPRRRHPDSRDRYIQPQDRGGRGGDPNRRRDGYRAERDDNNHDNHGRRGRDSDEQDRPRYDSRRSDDGEGRRQRDEAERARKLAAMQEAASDLDTDRQRRLAALEEAEREAREADGRARQRSNKYGGSQEFMSSLHRKAGDMDLAERIGRGRQGLQHEED